MRRAASKRIVLIKVEQVRPLVSPRYDRGVSENQVREQWERYYRQIRPRMSDSQTGAEP